MLRRWAVLTSLIVGVSLTVVAGSFDTQSDLAGLQSSAEQGDPEAQYRMGFSFLGKDIEKVVYWYRKAAEQGHAGAQMAIGQRYMTGSGLPEDDRLATYWLRKAAEQGLFSAQDSLALYYEHGRGGVPKDYMLAYKWLILAAICHDSPEERDRIERMLTPSQIEEGQRRAREWSEEHQPRRCV